MARTAFTRIGSTSLALSDVDFDRAMQGQDSNIVAQFNKVQSKVRHQLRKSAAVIDYIKSMIVQAKRKSDDKTAAKEAFYAVCYNVAYSSTGDKAQAATIASKQLAAFTGERVTTKELVDIAVLIHRKNPSADIDVLTDALDMQGDNIAGRSYVTLGSLVIAHRAGQAQKFIDAIDWDSFMTCAVLAGDRFEVLNDKLSKHFMSTLLSVMPWMDSVAVRVACEGIYGEELMEAEK